MATKPTYHHGELLYPAFHPDGKPLTVRITRQTLLRRARLGEWMLNELEVTVSEVLERPDAIFEGIRQEEDENKGPNGAGWWCYAGIPSTRYVDYLSGARKPTADEVYLVFVTDENVAYNLRWESVGSNLDWLGEEHPDRFRRRIYLSPRMKAKQNDR